MTMDPGQDPSAFWRDDWAARAGYLRSAVSAPRDSLMTRYGPFAVCAAVLIWHALQYGFITDDAYISFVYARNFAEHGELSFNLGDPVEGYTNFLWTLLLGLLMVVGLAPESTSLALGIGFGCATLLAVQRTVEYLLATSGRGSDAWPWNALPGALLGFCAGYACWSSGGLETQMFTFLCTLALYTYTRGGYELDARDAGGDGAVAHERRWLRRTGVVLALAAMTRPEGLLLTGLVGLHRLVFNLGRERRLLPNRDELACLGYFLALWAPWFAWRWWYYGYPFPNTYYVKAAGTPPPGYAEKMLQNGLYYVWQWANQSKALYAAPVIVAGLVAARPGARRMYYGSLALAFGVVYLLYTVRVGGDFMGLHRFIMPVFAICAVGVALGLWLVIRLVGALSPRLQERRSTLAVVAAIVAVAAVGLYARDQIALTHESMAWRNWRSDRGIDTPSYLRIYTLDRAAIGAHTRGCFRPDDFSIVGGAGAQPYKARMRGIDVFGLVSERVAHEVAPTRARAGHQKWAPDKLLLEHDPDFVLSCYSIHTRPDNPRFNCHKGFWLRNGYEPVTLHIPTLRQMGTYYTFFKRKGREFACPGLQP